MRITLAALAAALVALGIWLIAAGFISTEPPATVSPVQIETTPRPTAGPVALGLALLAGGGLLFVLLLRRR